MCGGGENLPDDGFTLLEMLVALLLLALATALLPGALRLGQRALSAPEAFDAKSEAVQGLAALQTKLAQAVPIRRSGKEGAIFAIDFEGRPDGVSFVAVAPMSVGVRSLVRYAITRDAGSRPGVTIALKRLGGDERLDEENAVIQLSGDQRMSLRYFGRKSGEREAQWADDWVDQPALPQLVSWSAGGSASATPAIVDLKLAR